MFVHGSTLPKSEKLFVFFSELHCNFAKHPIIIPSIFLLTLDNQKSSSMCFKILLSNFFSEIFISSNQLLKIYGMILR